MVYDQEVVSISKLSKHSVSRATPLYVAECHQLTTQQHTSESAQKSRSDASCLACLDFAMELPCLPDDAKDAIAQRLNLIDLSRCLLARKSSSCWQLSKHYLSSVRLHLQCISAGEETKVMIKAMFRSMNCLSGGADAVTRQDSVSELERIIVKGCDMISTCFAHAQLHNDSVSSAGCSGGLCSIARQMQGNFEKLLASSISSRQLMMTFKQQEFGHAN